MSLFSKLTKNSPDKTMFPWSQKKLNGSHHTVPRSGHVATALSSDNIVVYGGIHKGSMKKDISYIDTNTLSANHLSTSGDIPNPRKHTAIVAMGNFVLLYGGEPLTANEPWDPNFYLLNINNRQWTRMQMTGTIPPERSGHTAVAVGGVMYVWGGQHNGRYFNELLAFNTSTYPENPHWELVHNGRDAPSGRAGHVSVVYDNRLYIFGGSDGDHMYNDIWAFDFQTRVWAQVPAAGFIPTAREHCAAALVDDAMYVLGGRDPDRQELNDLCAFRIRSQRWYMFQNMGPSPSPRHSLTMTAVKEKMFVIGGEIKLGIKADDTAIYILDSAKIKYPPEPTPQQQQQQQLQQQQQQQLQSASNVSPSSSSFSLPDPDMTHSTSSSMHQYQQQQLQQQQMRGHTPSPSQLNNSQSTPTRSIHSQSSPTSQTSSHQQQQQQLQHQHQINGHHPSPYPDNAYSDNTGPQPSASSPVPNAPRHKSYYPEQNQMSSQQPPRPPRHVSTVPEAALRRPRTTSPLPSTEDLHANDMLEANNSNIHLGMRPSPSPVPQQQQQQLLLPDEGGADPYLSSSSSAQQQQQPPPPQQHRVSPTSSISTGTPTMNGPGGRTTPGVISPPPRPSREGVKLNHTMMEQSNFNDTGRRYDPSTSTLAQRAMAASPQQAPTIPPPQPPPPSASSSPLPPPQSQPQPQQHQQQPPPPQRQQHSSSSSSSLSSSFIDRPTEEVNGRSSSPAMTSHTNNNNNNSNFASSTSEQRKKADDSNNGAERATLMREIKARDLIISEMKKKEQWWRTEVSLARKQRPRTMTPDEEGDDEDEHMLMSLGDLEHDKLKLFEQLVTVKSELRRVRANITQQAQPMSDKVATAERMRTAALQEAMYFKSKYLALKSQLSQNSNDGRTNDDDNDDDAAALLEKIHDQRVHDLEKRLVMALAENEKNTKLMQQWQRRAQHDHGAKQSAEERAKEAHARAEEAQQAYQRGLEELDTWHARATRAEQQQRDSHAKIADLTSQLSQALQAVAKAAAEAELAAKEKSEHDHQHRREDHGDEEEDYQLKVARLEAAHLKARNDAATLQQRLAEAMDDIARLKGLVAERNEALQESQSQLEDANMQLTMLREAIQHRQQKALHG